GLLILILWLLLKMTTLARQDWRLATIVVALLFVLTNTYHTWSTYTAILGFASLAIGLAFPAIRRGRRGMTHLLAYASMFWLFTAFYLGSGVLYQRFVDGVTSLRT